MRRLLAALTITATLAAPAAHAQTLPKGWLAGAAAPEKAPAPKRREFGSLQANHEFTFPIRPDTRGERFHLDEVPIVEVAPSRLPEAPPRELPAGLPSEAVLLKKGPSPRLSLQGVEAGFVRVGGSLPTAVGPSAEGGASGVCNAGGALTSFSYESIRRVDKAGTLEHVRGRGYLDPASCRVAVVEREVARPRHLAGGYLFAFRTRCAACTEGERDLLHVITPQTNDTFGKAVPFEHRSFPLGPGRSGAFEGSINSIVPGYWMKWLTADGHGVAERCKGSALGCLSNFRFEVSQGRGEPTPTVFIGRVLGR